MNKSEQDENNRLRHEYILMEIRLSAEDVKDHIHKKYEPRVSALEHWRTALATAYSAICIGVGLWFKTHSK